MSCTATAVLGRTALASATFVTGLGYLPAAHYRAYDSRTAGIDKVPAHSVVRVPSSTIEPGVLGGPVSLTVTVANPKAAGYLTVYADDRPRPNVSTLNFATGLTVANPTTVSLGNASYIDSERGFDIRAVAPRSDGAFPGATAIAL